MQKFNLVNIILTVLTNFSLNSNIKNKDLISSLTKLFVLSLLFQELALVINKFFYFLPFFLLLMLTLVVFEYYNLFFLSYIVIRKYSYVILIAPFVNLVTVLFSELNVVYLIDALEKLPKIISWDTIILVKLAVLIMATFVLTKTMKGEKKKNET
jgi:hypothetical protein